MIANARIVSTNYIAAAMDPARYVRIVMKTRILMPRLEGRGPFLVELALFMVLWFGLLFYIELHPLESARSWPSVLL